MKKPKVYIDEDGNISIKFGKDYERDDCSVTLIHDRGTERKYNFFGDPIERFTYHHANAYGDTGYASTDDSYNKGELGTEYKLIKKARTK